MITFHLFRGDHYNFEGNFIRSIKSEVWVTSPTWIKNEPTAE